MDHLSARRRIATNDPPPLATTHRRRARHDRIDNSKKTERHSAWPVHSHSQESEAMTKRHLKLATSSNEDPIYAAIDRHKAAVAATEASGENVADKLSDRDTALARKLMATVPTTREGLLAMLGYTRQAEEAQAISLGSNDDQLAALLSSIESAVRTLPDAHPSSSAPEEHAEMEAPLLDARGLTKALIMAIAGEHRVAMETDEMNDALERLALALDERIDEAVKIWEGRQALAVAS
jgi:hypothetical protein